MIGNISARYAWRSLGRHPRRTILSMAGVGIGVAIGLIATAWIRGAMQMEIRSVCESGIGYIRIVPRGWIENRENSLRLPDTSAALATARGISDVQDAAPHSRVNGLLAFGNRTAGVEMLGVDPDVEERINRLVFKGHMDGRYLRPADSGVVVIGRTIADRLRVGVDDDLYVTLAGKDGIESAMLRIVGIISTGGRDVDASICHVMLEDIDRLTSYKGAGEIVIMLDDYRKIPEVIARLRDRLDDPCDVLSWQEIDPGMAAGIEGDRAFMSVLVAIVIVVVGLGILSAQLTAVLERRREVAVLIALGMKARQMMGLIGIEAVAVAMGGSFFALALGGSMVYYLAAHGVSLAALMGGDMSFGAVLLDPTIHADFGVWLVPYALIVSTAATVVASVYPAWIASRVEPADALRM
jgi:ABC-type lipoprotein release transport system permease subunit